GVNTRYGVHELAHLLGRAEPVGIVVPARFLDLDFAGRLHQARATADDHPAPWVAVARAQPGEDLASFELGGGTWNPAPAAPAGSKDQPLPAKARPDDPVNYFTT